MTTEEIFSQLRAFGIPIDAVQYTREAPRFYAAEQCADDWWRRYTVTARGYDEDFPWMASIVLWERLLPDVMNSERLDHMMQEGYTALESHDRQRACRLWLEVWEHLKSRITPSMRSVRDAEQVFSGLQSLFNWCQDLELELGNAGLDAREFNELRQKYCAEFCALLPETETYILVNMKRAVAESYFWLGRSEEGDQAFQLFIGEFPREAFSYFAWGDMYHWNPRKVWPVDYDKAERIYRLALENNVMDRNIILERLEMLEASRRKTDSTATN